MSYTIQVFLKSNSFDEDYADEKYEGKDAPENIRFEWEDEFRLKEEVKVVEIVRDQAYELKGELGEGRPFSYKIEDVVQFVFHHEVGETTLVFSETCVDEYELNHDRRRLIMYLNDNEVVENPIPGIYIVLSSFPKELRN